MKKNKYKCEKCGCDCHTVYWDKKNKRWICGTCKIKDYEFI